MACAGVVDRGAALQGCTLQPFHQQQAQIGVQLVQQGRQGGAHDPRTHQHDVEAVQGGAVAELRLWVDRCDAFLGLGHSNGPTAS